MWVDVRGPREGEGVARRVVLYTFFFFFSQMCECEGGTVLVSAFAAENAST